jgi:hypothetical protein
MCNESIGIKFTTFWLPMICYIQQFTLCLYGGKGKLTLGQSSIGSFLGRPHITDRRSVSGVTEARVLVANKDQCEAGVLVANKDQCEAGVLVANEDQYESSMQTMTRMRANKDPYDFVHCYKEITIQLFDIQTIIPTFILTKINLISTSTKRL